MIGKDITESMKDRMKNIEETLENNLRRGTEEFNKSEKKLWKKI
jgi:hypothetical protein